jgi:hypothetical protein
LSKAVLLVDTKEAWKNSKISLIKRCAELFALLFYLKIALQLLEGQERKRLIDLHTQLEKVIYTELLKRNTSDLSLVEEAIIANSSSDVKKQVMTILSPSSTSAPEKVFHPTDKLRLVIS